MRIEEAIVWLLSTEGRGMTAETLAEQIHATEPVATYFEGTKVYPM